MSEESTTPAAIPDQAGLNGSLPSSRPVPTSQPFDIWRATVETVLLVAVMFLIINTAIGRFRIEQVSMLPNLHEGEYVIVDKISYLLHPPERGDIIVLKRAGSPDLIKRVIGLPGDTLEIHTGQVFINGVALNEPYLAQPIVGGFPAHTIEPGHYFVMGDNRNNSEDSRIFGAVPGSDIIGRAWLIYWPPPNWQIVPHYTYAAAASP